MSKRSLRSTHRINQVKCAMATAAAAVGWQFLSPSARANTAEYFDQNGVTAGSGITSGATYTWDNSTTLDWDLSQDGTGASIKYNANGTPDVYFAAGFDSGVSYSVATVGTLSQADSINILDGAPTIGIAGNATLDQPVLINQSGAGLLVASTVNGNVTFNAEVEVNKGTNIVNNAEGTTLNLAGGLAGLTNSYTFQLLGWGNITDGVGLVDPIPGSKALTLATGTLGTVTFASSGNAFSGGITDSGSTLVGTQTSGTPFGTGSIALRNGVLDVAPVGGSGAVVVSAATAATTSALTVGFAGAGGAEIVLNKGTASSLVFDVGLSNGTASELALNTTASSLIVEAASGLATLGNSTSGESLVVQNSAEAPAITNGLVSTRIVGLDGTTGNEDFLGYNATQGLVSGSSLSIYQNNSLATGSTTVANITTPTSTSGNSTLYGAIVTGTSATISSGNTLTIAAGGGVILNGGTISGSGALTLPSSGVFNFSTGTSGGTISAPMNWGSGDTAVVSGVGTLTINGSVNGGPNWDIDSGTLAIGSDAELGTNTGDTVALGGGTLLATNSFTLGTSRSLLLTTSTISTLSAASNQTLTIPKGFASGSSGNLVIAGPGTVAFSNSTGSPNLSGSILVNSGVLLISNASGSATGTGAVTLNGGTLATPAGSSAVISSTISAGQTTNAIAPGNGTGVGTLTTSNSITVDGHSTLDFYVASPTSYSQILMTGTGNAGEFLFDGSGKATIAITGTVASGNTYNLITGITDTAALFPLSDLSASLPGGYTGTLSFASTDLKLSVTSSSHPIISLTASAPQSNYGSQIVQGTGVGYQGLFNPTTPNANALNVTGENNSYKLAQLTAINQNNGETAATVAVTGFNPGNNQEEFALNVVDTTNPGNIGTELSQLVSDINGATYGFDASVASTSDPSPALPSGANYLYLTFTPTELATLGVTSGSDYLGFDFSSSNDPNLGSDVLVVTAVDAVPEPTNWASILVLGGIGALLRRRQRKTIA